VLAYLGCANIFGSMVPLVRAPHIGFYCDLKDWVCWVGCHFYLNDITDLDQLNNI